MWVGGQWGFGHGLGASLMGFIAFTVKGRINIEALSNWMEAIVGITLIVIGLMGLSKARKWSHNDDSIQENFNPHLDKQLEPADIDLEALEQMPLEGSFEQQEQHELSNLNNNDDNSNNASTSPPSSPLPSPSSSSSHFKMKSRLLNNNTINNNIDYESKRIKGNNNLGMNKILKFFNFLNSNSNHKHSHGTLGHSVTGSTILLTGIFHGFSGTGHLLGVMPALTLSSYWAASSYLIAFCIGTMMAMSIFTGGVGEASIRMGERLKRPTLPSTLSFFTSIFAIFMGSLWILKTLIF